MTHHPVPLEELRVSAWFVIVFTTTEVLCARTQHAHGLDVAWYAFSCLECKKVRERPWHEIQQCSVDGFLCCCLKNLYQVHSVSCVQVNLIIFDWCCGTTIVDLRFIAKVCLL